MPHTYILKSLKDFGYYVGSARDLDDRLTRHQEGRSRPTKTRRPLQLVYKKWFKTYVEAYRFERYIKKQKSKKFIEKLIKENKERQKS